MSFRAVISYTVVATINIPSTATTKHNTNIFMTQQTTNGGIEEHLRVEILGEIQYEHKDKQRSTIPKPEQQGSVPWPPLNHFPPLESKKSTAQQQ
jgi:hypothetical protein